MGNLININVRPTNLTLLGRAVVRLLLYCFPSLSLTYFATCSAVALPYFRIPSMPPTNHFHLPTYRRKIPQGKGYSWEKDLTKSRKRFDHEPVEEPAMDSTRPLSPHLARCRSGTPRLCQVEPTLSPILTVQSLPRSNSAAKSRPLSSPDTAARQHGYGHRRRCKDNRKSPEPAGGSTAVKLSPTAPWMTPSAWALSPGRYPSEEAKGGGGRRMMSGMFGFLRKKKEPSAREEMGHQLRMLAVRLLQWRFVNARTGAATATAKFAVEKKIFFAFLKITELRNIVAAKWILISRRKYKLKVIKMLNPQLNLLNRWELLARRHLDALASLSGVLEARCLKLPLAEGAQANNLVVLQQFICEVVDIMSEIEAAISIFFSKAELVNSLLSELLQVMQEEAKSLDELWKTNSLISSLKAHEISLRANLIQGTKKEAAFSPHRTYEINTGESCGHFRAGFLI